MTDAGWYTVYFDWNYFSIIFIWYKCQCGERADPPGKFFYLQVVCGNNVKSEAVKTNIFIKSKASRFIGTDTKVSENFKFGNGVGYTVPEIEEIQTEEAETETEETETGEIETEEIETEEVEIEETEIEETETEESKDRHKKSVNLNTTEQIKDLAGRIELAFAVFDTTNNTFTNQQFIKRPMEFTILYSGIMISMMRMSLSLLTRKLLKQMTLYWKM